MLFVFVPPEMDYYLPVELSHEVKVVLKSKKKWIWFSRIQGLSNNNRTHILLGDDSRKLITIVDLDQMVRCQVFHVGRRWNGCFRKLTLQVQSSSRSSKADVWKPNPTPEPTSQRPERGKCCKEEFG